MQYDDGLVLKGLFMTMPFTGELPANYIGLFLMQSDLHNVFNNVKWNMSILCFLKGMMC